MYTNIIPLKENLDFRQYQLAVKALEDIGIAIADPDDDFYYELSPEDFYKLAIAEKQAQMGMFTDSTEVHKKAKQMIDQWK